MINPAATLPRDAPMYEEYYGFVQSPFTLAPDPRFLYLSETHDEAIRLLLQSIRRKEGFIVLTGDIGTGKTTLCRALIEQLDASTFTSLVLNPFVSIEELLQEVLLDFGVVSRDTIRTGRLSTSSKHQLISTLHEFLTSLQPIGGVAVLIIDEAQHLTTDVLEQIRVLSNLETNNAKLLQIILVGQLNLLDVLAGANMRQLDQRISMKALLKPLSRTEIEAYIGHRLGVAAAASSVTFDAPALDLVHRHSGGTPRVINLLCDRSLMLGAQAGTGVISEEIVRKAAESLGLKVLGRVKRGRRVPRWVLVAAGIVLLLALAAFAALKVIPGRISSTPPAAPASPPVRTAPQLPAPVAPNPDPVSPPARTPADTLVPTPVPPASAVPVPTPTPTTPAQPPQPPAAQE